MVCPDCGYVLSAFDKECPRCEKVKDKSLQNPYVRHQEASATEQAPPAVKPGTSALDYLELDAAPAQHDGDAPPPHASVMFCVHCGTRLAPQGRFCAKCGQPAAASDGTSEAVRQKPQESLPPSASVHSTAEFYAPRSQPPDPTLRAAAPTPTGTSTQIATGIFTGVFLLIGVIMVMTNLVVMFSPGKHAYETETDIRAQSLSGNYVDPLKENADRKAAQYADGADKEAAVVWFVVGIVLTFPFLVVWANASNSSPIRDSEPRCPRCDTRVAYSGTVCPHCSPSQITPGAATAALTQAVGAPPPEKAAIPNQNESRDGTTQAGKDSLRGAAHQPLTPAMNSAFAPQTNVEADRGRTVGGASRAADRDVLPPTRQPKVPNLNDVVPSPDSQQARDSTSKANAKAHQSQDEETSKSKYGRVPVKAGVIVAVVTVVIGLACWLVRAEVGFSAARRQLAQARVCLTQAQAATSRFQVASLTPPQANALLQSGSAQYQAAQKWSRDANPTPGEAATATKLQQAATAGLLLIQSDADAQAARSLTSQVEQDIARYKRAPLTDTQAASVRAKLRSQCQAALQDCRQSLDTNPANAVALAERVRALHFLGDAGAQAALTQALRVAPGNPFLLAERRQYMGAGR